MAGTLRVTLYTRQGCHLCEEARAAILRGGEGLPIELRVVDVDGDPALARAYGEELPVVFIGERKAFKVRFTAEQFRERAARWGAEAGWPA